MSAAVIAHGVAYLSGQVPAQQDAGIEAQTADVLDRISRLLIDCGSSPADVLNATIYLRDMADFDAMNGVWEHWLPAGCAPARTTVQAAMARRACRIEITVQALVRESQATSRS